MLVHIYIFSNSLARPSVSYVTMLLTGLIRFQLKLRKSKKMRNEK